MKFRNKLVSSIVTMWLTVSVATQSLADEISDNVYLITNDNLLIPTDKSNIPNWSRCMLFTNDIWETSQIYESNEEIWTDFFWKLDKNTADEIRNSPRCHNSNHKINMINKTF